MLPKDLLICPVSCTHPRTNYSPRTTATNCSHDAATQCSNAIQSGTGYSAYHNPNSATDQGSIGSARTNAAIERTETIKINTVDWVSGRIEVRVHFLSAGVGGGEASDGGVIPAGAHADQAGGVVAGLTDVHQGVGHRGVTAARGVLHLPERPGAGQLPQPRPAVPHRPRIQRLDPRLRRRRRITPPPSSSLSHAPRNL